MSCCTITPERIEEIAQDVKTSVPGGWANQVNYGPACTCGMRPKLVGTKFVKERCYRHGVE